ncbi:hypothetical protein DKX38_029713 [Salix brachista]|uniref:Plastocyanin-like domain-containing protein n=1 Tax=Salix brachista TaxID=2182728 RepID=A0A5N5J4P8_9ROSI|nr:hypothetical protein DKX38_029713 [Salix brachista]
MGICRLGFLVGFLWFMAMDCMAQSNTHHYNFVLQQAQFTRLCETKTMLTVNGSFPGPTIHARRGDTIYVNVHNEGEYGVTIHWHGVKQPRNPWSDGPENITQCPIQPGKNFTYEIILSNEEGTLWWHAHSDWSRATVHGAIVIAPALGTTYPFPAPDAEETIIIGRQRAIIDEALATGQPPEQSNSLTINGQPGDLYPCSAVLLYSDVKYGSNFSGVWFIHCHLERHSSWGMDTVLIVRNGRTRATSMRPPPASLPSCS